MQGPSYDRGAILQELDRIVSSEEFCNSDRLCRFLTFVVERSLAEEGDQLKESVLGVEVFGRPAGYDPKVDPIVRTEARRLRAKLESFYSRCGVSLEWEIQVPKGSYVAEFRHEPKPLVKVLPLVMPPAPTPRLEIVPSPAGSALPLSQRETNDSVPEPPSGPVLLHMPARLRLGGRYWWPALAVLAVIGVAATYYLVLGRQTKNDFFVRPLSTMPGRADFPSLSPDGNQVAFTWDGPNRGVPQIYLIMSEGGEPRQLTQGSEPNTVPIWSPDGRRIAYFRRDRQLMLITPLGEERQLGEAIVGSIAWTPDARHILVLRESPEGQSIHQIAVDQADSEQIIVPPQRRGRVIQFALASDGRRLALLVDRGGGSEIILRDVRSGNEEVVVKDDSALGGVAWAPDGNSLVFGSFRLGRPTLFRKFLGSSEEPISLAGVGSEAVHPSVARTREGKMRISYSAGRIDTNLWQFSLDGNHKPSGEAKRLTLSDRRDDSGQFSPDAKRIAFLSTRNARRELFVAEADGSNVRKLAGEDRQNIFDLRWSADGERILYVSLDSTGPKLGIVSVAGGVPCYLPVSGDLSGLAWSPSGREVWFLRAKAAPAPAGGNENPSRGRREPVFEVASMPADACGKASEPSVVPLQAGVSEVRWVPEEQMLYSLRRGDLFRQRWPGGEAELVGRNVLPNWWASSEAGVFLLRPVPEANGPPRSGELWLLAKDGGAARLLETLPGNFEFGRTGLSVTRDAKRLMMNRVDDFGSHIYLATER